jgi:hypothetical protein
VPPAGTEVAEAVTAMFAVGAGGGVVLPEPVGVGVGVEVGGSVAPTELPPEPELLVEPVLLGVGVGVGVALVVGSLALGELDAWVADALLEAAGVAVAAELAVRAVADGLADADGETAAMAVPVTPLVITNRPVARPTVAGRECADRMRTPCLWLLSRLENVPSRTLCRSGRSGWLLIGYIPIRHQNRRLVPPLHHTWSQVASASSPSVTAFCRSTGPDISGPEVPTIPVPRSVPFYARLSEERPERQFTAAVGRSPEARLSSASGYRSRCRPAASAPPTSGATMNSHTWLRAVRRGEFTGRPG